MAVRNSIPQNIKAEANSKIFNLFVSADFISVYDTFLCYISVNSEADTYRIINYLLECGKRVAVPYCCSKKMEFYEITSAGALVVGAYGIPTVDIDKHRKVEDFSNTLCIVPALSFDLKGNRLGYGGGYYDRFLSENKIKTLGICYDKCLCNNLPAEEHDINIDMILTETGLETINIKEANTYE